MTTSTKRIVLGLFLIAAGIFAWRYMKMEKDAMMPPAENPPVVVPDTIPDSSGPTETATPAPKKGISVRGTAWNWQKTTNADGSVTVAKDPSRFVLTLDAEGRFTSKTDCNNVSGIYALEGEVLSLGQMISTKMYCEGSQENAYVTALGRVASYHVEGNTLTLILWKDLGTMTFTTN